MLGEWGKGRMWMGKGRRIHIPCSLSQPSLSNNIGDVGAQALADAFKTITALTTLQCVLVMVTDLLGGQGKAECEWAWHRNRGAQGGFTFHCPVLHCSLSSLENNNIRDEGALALAEALMSNTALTTLKCVLVVALVSGMILLGGRETRDYRRARDGKRVAASDSITLHFSSFLPLHTDCTRTTGAQKLAKVLKTNTALATPWYVVVDIAMVLWCSCLRKQRHEGIHERARAHA